MYAAELAMPIRNRLTQNMAMFCEAVCRIAEMMSATAQMNMDHLRPSDSLIFPKKNPATIEPAQLMAVCKARVLVVRWKYSE